MAADLKTYLQENASSGPFVPCAHYDADAPTVFLSNVPEYARRLNSRVTSYLSDATNELVGCRVQGVRSVLQDIGWFDISIYHGKAKLKIALIALHETLSLSRL